MTEEILAPEVIEPVAPVMPAPTAEEIARNYTAALDSVSLINDVIAGTQMADERITDEERKAAVERNVGHLTIMVGKDYWTNEDLTPFNEAIAAGNAYLA